MIKYIGSKRRLLPAIRSVVERLIPGGTVLDLFSGTSRVGHMLKSRGYRVIANDHNAYAEVLARCFVVADRKDVERDAVRLIRELNALKGTAGYFTEQYCLKARFVQPRNGERVDAIREEIARKSLEPELEAVLLTSLMMAVDRVDSTTGVQMAFLKNWAPRSYRDLELRLPHLLERARSGKGRASRLDALDAAATLRGDLAYIDPPYNQHSYLGNYHLWETLALWDRPATYGVANKRMDCRDRRSVFNSRERFAAAFEQLIRALDVRFLVVSFSDEGFLAPKAMEAILRRRGDVEVLTFDNLRYVGARIGIFDPSGRKVGKVSHTRNNEHVYVVGARGGLSPAVRPAGGGILSASGSTPVAAAADRRDGPVRRTAGAGRA
ncbi:MAG: DNA adenine methylase [Planctomycetota bacterium]